MTNKKILDGEWKLRIIGKPPDGVRIPKSGLTGTVPGTVHTSLMSAGFISDPFYRDNESKVQWIEDLDWEYSREFELSEEEVSWPAIYLTFEGIDTVAEVYLNGKHVLHAENMFVIHRIRIERFVRKGANVVRVLIRSPKLFAIRREKKFGQIFAELDSYRVHIRKAQYSFGWDWGPRLATSGIWRGVHLDFVRDVSIGSVHLSTVELKRGGVKAKLDATFHPVSSNGMRGKRIKLSVTDGSVAHEFEFPIAQRKREEVTLPRVEPWWTHDFGNPKLYDVEIQVLDKSDTAVSSKKFSTGFRTIRLLHERDKLGESFMFELNGERIFIKGANWIPADSFLPRVDKAKYKALVGAARNAGMNMLRVWGGGVYEDEEFYRTCDENGILVWQDFMFACASYPEYELFLKEVETEAEQNVERISNHPGSAIFCGNNEAEWIWQMKTGMPIDEMPGAPTFKQRLAAVVKNVSPEVPYWRSSPFGGESPNSQSEGDHHQWDIWSAYRSPSEYRQNVARFVSEFGFQAPPSLGTIESFTLPEDRDLQSPIMRAHNKQVEGTERLFRFLSGEVKVASDFEDTVLQMQLVQAKAIKAGVANWRARKWNTAGVMFWQLNDCWPVSSWSAIDYRMRPKALYYRAKEFYKPVKVFIAHENGRLEAHVVNDTRHAVAGGLKINVTDIRGNVVETSEMQVRVAKNGVSHFHFAGIPVGRVNDVYVEAVLTEQVTGKVIDKQSEIFVPWLDFNFESPKIEMHLVKEEKGTTVTLTSDRFIQGVYLPLDEEVGQLSDNFFDLLPGKPTCVHYLGKQIPDGFQPKLPLLANICAH